MEPFFQPDRLWPAGHRQLQLMIIPDLELDPGLAELITAARKVMIGHPATTEPVPDESLHLTVQAIHRPGHGHVDTARRGRLISALESELATVPAFEMLIGSLLVQHRGVVADTHHRDRFNHVLNRARPVIADICGPDAIAYDSRPAHMALCYAGGHSSSDDLQRDLRHQLHPSHATLTVRAVQLVETVQVPNRYRYDSTALHRFTLATTEAPATTPDAISKGVSV
jgi:2'-5' RNA ligase